ncbi:DUF2797 domain-containing protein, partial [bacterium]|nr:DUF2797 domain-containing protein [bacterium]
MIVKKLQANIINNHVNYEHPYYLQSLNLWIDQTVSFSWNGSRVCIGCSRSQKKIIQGYCYLCSQRLACCDLCIVKPELCHFHLGTCREPQWGLMNCMQSHVIYLSLTSHPKIGITRLTQLPTRWIDQGAVWAVPLARTQSRYHAGLLEVLLAEDLSDQTAWRKLIMGDIEHVEDRLLLAQKTQMRVQEVADLKKIPIHIEPLEFVDMIYPVTAFLKKPTTINLEKNPTFIDTLLGIKGQYLLFKELGAINMR